MEKTIRTQFVKEFLEAVLTLESVDECMDFFEDVCTVKEVDCAAVCGCEASEGWKDLCGGSERDRRFDRDDQPCKPVLKLRKCKLR